MTLKDGVGDLTRMKLAEKKKTESETPLLNEAALYDDLAIPSILEKEGAIHLGQHTYFQTEKGIGVRKNDEQVIVVPADAEITQTFIAEMEAITKVEQVIKGDKNIIKILFKNGNNLQLDFGSNARERRVIFDALKYIKK
ncbi:hypothetical protein E4P35_13060 [Thiopseudomonas sp. 4R-3cl]|nr:hypothetical protein E4P35_13060 [Thiopseudomonas sp. 4R-3cl]